MGAFEFINLYNFEGTHVEIGKEQKSKFESINCYKFRRHVVAKEQKSKFELYKFI